MKELLKIKSEFGDVYLKISQIDGFKVDSKTLKIKVFINGQEILIWVEDKKYIQDFISIVENYYEREEKIISEG